MASSAERNYVLTSVRPSRRPSLHASLQQQQLHADQGGSAPSGSVAAIGTGADTHGFPPSSSLQAQTSSPFAHTQQHAQRTQPSHSQQHPFQPQQQSQHPSSAQHPYPNAPQYTYPPSPASPTLSPAQQAQQQQYGRIAQPPPQQPSTGIYSPINTHTHHNGQPVAPYHTHHHHETYPPRHAAAAAASRHGHDSATTLQAQTPVKSTAASESHGSPYNYEGSPRNPPTTSLAQGGMPIVRRSRSSEWQGEYPSAACSYPENKHLPPSHVSHAPTPQLQQHQRQPSSHNSSSFERYHHQHAAEVAEDPAVSNAKGQRAYPPPIQTQWSRPVPRQQLHSLQQFQEHPSSAVVEPRDYRTPSYQSGSSYLLSAVSNESSSIFSPTTPRSTPLYHGEMVRPSFYTESPVDYTMSPGQDFPPNVSRLRSIPPPKHLAGFPYQTVAQPPLSSSTLNQYQPHQLSHQYHQQLPRRYGPFDDDHDMEHCSEQDDAREREENERRRVKRVNDDDDDETDKLGPLAGDALGGAEATRESSKKSRSKQLSRTTSATSKRKAKSAVSVGDDEDIPSQFMQSPVSSGTSSRKPSLTNSDDKPARLPRTKSSPSQKRSSRQSSVRGSQDDLYDQPDENPGTQTAKTEKGCGLRKYSQRVCEYVREKGTTTYIKLVNELAGHGGDSDDPHPTAVQEGSGQENIRRRVYDALNVLEAMGIIRMDKNEGEKKEIQWIGVGESSIVNEVTMRAEGRRPSAVDEPDIESEEPGVDDMELENLEKKTAALTMSNTLLRAQLHDQITRHVQLVNLVKRNKEREAAAAEAKEERRRRREEKHRRRAEREAKKRGEEDIKEVVILRPERLAERVLEEFSQPESDQQEPVRISLDRRRKHRSHRHRRSPRPSEADVGGNAEGDGPHHREDHENENDEESKERRRKREKEERRERRRQEKKLAKKQLAEQQRQQQLQHLNYQQSDQFQHAQHYQRRAAEESEEEQRIQLPMFVMKMPLYACQSSDSEASINVVRRLHKEQRPRKSGKNKRHCGAGEETTMVEIKMPYQEDLNVISDSEVLSEMGLNEISHQSLRQLLTKELMDHVQYSTNQAQLDGDVSEVHSVHRRHHHSVSGRQRSEGMGDEEDGDDEDADEDEDGLESKTVWVRRGFERQIILARDSGYASAVSGVELSSSLDG
ncbi:hypothetical protein BGW41_008129 [Actinomortierella wolfii]|nr:hypothetical protein BGW41_008129 [Actinomortierella wolfii]